MLTIRLINSHYYLCGEMLAFETKINGLKLYKKR